MTEESTPPDRKEFEVTLFGPGYGESIVLHIGRGDWVIVDSCIDRNGKPRALQYLESLGVDTGRDVRLVVATHWHDDHVRGMARLVDACKQADFCCASVLRREEFLGVVGALENRSPSRSGSGVREIYGVFSQLVEARRKPRFAIADRRIFSQGRCEVWSLSPSDRAFADFLRSVGNLLPDHGQSKGRIPALAPNTASVVLWIGIGDAVVLLGADMEKPGWLEILQGTTRPADKASVFKIPHHGSADADEPAVWQKMLDDKPLAVLTPWRRGGHALPKTSDVKRILSCTPRAYATARNGSLSSPSGRRNRTVNRTVRESGIRLRQIALSPGAVRLRRDMEENAQWRVETFGAACELQDFEPSDTIR